MALPILQSGGGGGGGGTVTSVTLTGDGTVLSSTPSAPVTTSGTLTAALANAPAGAVLGNSGTVSAAPSYTTSPVVGVPGTSTGTLALASSTPSGKFTVTAPASPATPTLTLPTTSNVLAGQFVGDGVVLSSVVSAASSAGTVSASLANAGGGTVLANTGTGAAAPAYTTAPVLGVPGTSTGTIALASATASGKYTLTAPANAATPTLTLPTTTGTLCSSASGALSLNATTGAMTFNGAGAVTWDQIGAAAANLILANAGFTTTFNQTSAAPWLWANTTTATVSTTNASPLLELAANYWTGAASAADTWTIGSSLAAGANGASTLTFTHSGSTGGNYLLFPQTVRFGNTMGGVGITLTSSGYVAIGTLNGAANWVFRNGYSLGGGSGETLQFSSTTDPNSGSPDVGISRKAAGVLAIGTGTNGSIAGSLQLNRITNYNGEATVAPGVAYIRGATSQRAETGADANVLTVTPAAAVGTYRITIVMDVSAASAATLGWTATWTNSNGTAEAPTNLPLTTALSGATGAVPAMTVTAAAGASYFAEAIVNVNNAGTNIVVKTTFSGTSIAYNVTATIERIV